MYYVQYSFCLVVTPWKWALHVLSFHTSLAHTFMICLEFWYVYYVSFIDDYSRKTWIYFLKGKNEVLNRFKEFKSLVENLSEKKINTFKSNNGGEFTLGEFKTFCNEVGIKRDLSTPYNPQQNRVAKAKN